MSHQPMGVSGIDLDIVTGLPRQPKSRAEREADIGLKEAKVLQEAAQLTHELPLVLPILARQLEHRLGELMATDSTCQSILQVIAALRMKVEVAPRVVSKMRRQSFGVVLNSMTDETKVALEGIPAED
jgi:hypothetical protein